MSSLFPSPGHDAFLCFSEVGKVVSVHRAAGKEGKQRREGVAVFAGGVRNKPRKAVRTL